MYRKVKQNGVPEGLTAPTPSANSSSTLASSLKCFQPKRWFHRFRNETAHTEFIELPSCFVSSLITGHAYSAETNTDVDAESRQHEWSDGTITTEDASTDDGSSIASLAPDQSGINLVNDAISSLRESEPGATIELCPKIETKCPVDATWAHFDRTIKCTSAADVITLLQASERSLAILSADEPATLSLRIWDESIDPRMEFRLFVRRTNVVGISTRSCNTSSFSGDSADELRSLLCDWHDRKIKGYFSDRYVVDVVVVCRPHEQNKVVRLVDFGPWGEDSPTDALLFQWSELEESPWVRATGKPQFRSVGDDPSSGGGMRPAQSMYDGIPLEMRQPDALTDLVGLAQQYVRNQMDNDENKENNG